MWTNATGQQQMEGFKPIVICCDDSNIFILALAFTKSIGASFHQRCGTETKAMIVDIGKIATANIINVCQAEDHVAFIYQLKHC